jgi:5'-deoxynucleotidase YfbR-like HD superfamily hydrolase
MLKQKKKSYNLHKSFFLLVVSNDGKGRPPKSLPNFNHQIKPHTLKKLTTTAEATFIPVTNFSSGKFNTSTGRTIDFLNPSEDQIDIEDIATALSRICRFGGHCSVFYTVAQHSLLVMKLVELSLADGKTRTNAKLNLEALLHDASEAYLGDMISPLKHIVGASYRTLEHNFETVIAQKFGISYTEDVKRIIKQSDILALELEHEALILGAPARLLTTLERFDLIDGNKWAWTEKAAKSMFLNRFKVEYALRNGHPIQG